MYTLKEVGLPQEFLNDSHKIFLSCEREILIFKILYHFSHWMRDWNWDNGLQRGGELGDSDFLDPHGKFWFRLLNLYYKFLV